MRPLVSVIIPVYNTAPYLEKCIRSVLASSYTIIEILAIDDGSTDGSGMILDRLAKEDSRLHVEHRENQGVAAARNRGIEAAAGDYITFVDSDDYISKHYIRHAIACMQRTGALMAVCGLTYVSTEGKILNRLIPGEYTRFRHEEWPMRISAVWAHFYRRSMWIESGLRFISGARGEDMPVALYFSASCENIVTVKDGGYYYVQHQGSAMHHFRGLKQYNLPYDALRDVFERLEREGIKNSREFYELFVMRIFCTCAFDLAKGADREKKKELADFISESLNRWFPEYYKNSLIYGHRDLDIPLVQRVAVRIFVSMQKKGLLLKVI